MVRRYTLRRPIVGFCRHERRVITIPAGTVITVMFRSGAGIASTEFEGQAILVPAEDIERNAVCAEVQ
jgi:hypothetical protein